MTKQADVFNKVFYTYTAGLTKFYLFSKIESECKYLYKIKAWAKITNIWANFFVTKYNFQFSLIVGASILILCTHTSI